MFSLAIDQIIFWGNLEFNFDEFFRNPYLTRITVISVESCSSINNQKARQKRLFLRVNKPRPIKLP